MRRPGIRHVRAPAASTLAPLDAKVLGPQLTLWLRSVVGVAQAGGTASAWADQSGRGNTFVQASGVIQPTYQAANANFNAAPSLTFSPTDSTMTCASTIEIKHLIIVANYPGVTFNDYSTLFTTVGSFVFRGEDTTASWRIADGIDGIDGIYRRDTVKTIVALDVASRPHIYERVFAAQTSLNSWQMGRDPGVTGRQWRGSVVEVIASNTLIPDRTLQGIRLGLKRRYGC